MMPARSNTPAATATAATATAFAGVIAALATTVAVQAAEYCVACTGPAAVYRCAPDGAGLGTDPRLQLLCASELARSGNHESCSVRRDTTGPCEGPQRVVRTPSLPAATTRDEDSAAPQASGSGSPTGSGAAGPSSAAAIPDGGSTPAAGRAASPSTAARQDVGTRGGEPGPANQAPANAVDAVSSAAQQAGGAVADTARSAGQMVGEAGSAAGKAAKKSWKCVLSLFSDC